VIFQSKVSVFRWHIIFFKLKLKWQDSFPLQIEQCANWQVSWNSNYLVQLRLALSLFWDLVFGVEVWILTGRNRWKSTYINFIKKSNVGGVVPSQYAASIVRISHSFCSSGPSLCRGWSTLTSHFLLGPIFQEKELNIVALMKKCKSGREIVKIR